MSGSKPLVTAAMGRRCRLRMVHRDKRWLRYFGIGVNGISENDVGVSGKGKEGRNFTTNQEGRPGDQLPVSNPHEFDYNPGVKYQNDGSS